VQDEIQDLQSSTNIINVWYKRDARGEGGSRHNLPWPTIRKGACGTYGGQSNAYRTMGVETTKEHTAWKTQDKMEE